MIRRQRSRVGLRKKPATRRRLKRKRCVAGRWWLFSCASHVCEAVDVLVSALRDDPTGNVRKIYRIFLIVFLNRLRGMTFFGFFGGTTKRQKSNGVYRRVLLSHGTRCISCPYPTGKVRVAFRLDLLAKKKESYRTFHSLRQLTHSNSLTTLY